MHRFEMQIARLKVVGMVGKKEASLSRLMMMMLFD
jgi:hypothetical protein